MFSETKSAHWKSFAIQNNIPLTLGAHGHVFLSYCSICLVANWTCKSFVAKLITRVTHCEVRMPTWREPIAWSSRATVTTYSTGLRKKTTWLELKEHIYQKKKCYVYSHNYNLDSVCVCMCNSSQKLPFIIMFVN